jgi:VIT1/CCC1 family predicted Fe2+/Mn2+ transporter
MACRAFTRIPSRSLLRALAGCAPPIRAPVTAASVAMPLALVRLMPRGALVLGVSVALLLLLALLGAIGARAGGAKVMTAALRVTFWGALALQLAAGIDAPVGTVA